MITLLLTSRRKSSEQSLKNMVPRVLVKNDNYRRNSKGSNGYSNSHKTIFTSAFLKWSLIDFNEPRDGGGG